MLLQVVGCNAYYHVTLGDFNVSALNTLSAAPSRHSKPVQPTDPVHTCLRPGSTTKTSNLNLHRTDRHSITPSCKKEEICACSYQTDQDHCGLSPQRSRRLILHKLMSRCQHAAQPTLMQCSVAAAGDGRGQGLSSSSRLHARLDTCRT